jgi:hypothetical protein
MRSKAFTKYKPLLEQIRKGCNENGTFAFNGIDETECPVDYGNAANKAASKIDSTMDSLGPLNWTPGLVIATQTATNIITASGIDPSSEAYTNKEKIYNISQLDKFGNTGQVTTGILFYGDNTDEITVARMLIDDFDQEATSALLNTAVTQVGVSATNTSKSWGQVGTVILDASFETKEPYKSCKMPVIPTIPGGGKATPCKDTNNDGVCGASNLALPLGLTVAAIMVALY